jgi:small nuclear ribonucleoprotein (snRNP)-like protein
MADRVSAISSTEEIFPSDSIQGQRWSVQRRSTRRWPWKLIQGRWQAPWPAGTTANDGQTKTRGDPGSLEICERKDQGKVHRRARRCVRGHFSAPGNEEMLKVINPVTVTGVLKGFDQLLNLVLDDVQEIFQTGRVPSIDLKPPCPDHVLFPSHPDRIRTNDTRPRSRRPTRSNNHTPQSRRWPRGNF